MAGADLTMMAPDRVKLTYGKQQAASLGLGLARRTRLPAGTPAVLLPHGLSGSVARRGCPPLPARERNANVTHRCWCAHQCSRQSSAATLAASVVDSRRLTGPRRFSSALKGEPQ